jgi:mannose/fructose/N-acetylgalactosamine-specific phosphotransferase system component IIB
MFKHNLKLNYFKYGRLKSNMKNTFTLKIIAILCLIFIINHSDYAQTLIKGTIRNSKDKSPLIGATVFIKKLNKGTASDSKGNYSIKLE